MQVCPSCGEENPAKFRLCGYCGTPLAAPLPVQEVRKVVSIVFSDLKGSTSLGESLDSEALREVLSRYFDEMQAVLESHGGTVEKYIGDAIMAVFGLPTLHEDDALRAVRAAYDMQRTLATLNEELHRRWGVTLTNRTGVNTGEVIAGDASTRQRLVTGDTVNVAARLEQAAPALEVLIGEPTYRLVRDAVEVEPVEPLELKGKAERVPAYRLLGVGAGAGIARKHDRPLVGRESDIAQLVEALDEALVERVCRLATVVAGAGVGKSRLIEEFTSGLAGPAGVVRGRCLPYGRGITFWPLVEIVRQAGSIREDDSPDEAREKLAALVGVDAVVDRIAAAIGLSEEQFPVDELFWGARKLIERIAEEQPLVVVIEDIHWAEPTFLELIEHLLVSLEDVPVLLLCASRPDLYEMRPGWGAHTGSLRIELAPLSPEESARVAENVLGSTDLPEAVRTRIVAAAEGNPLFVEQLLSMLVDDGQLVRDDADEGWIAADDLSALTIPPSINALLTARLDLLSAEERAVIEPASVVGTAFPSAALRVLVPDGVAASLDEHIASLTRKHLIRRETSATVADESFRFDHVLIRDAAYQGLLKRTRATMHEKFADWAEQLNRDRDRETEYEEILGYHLEQAHDYLAGLGPLDDHGHELGLRASARLGAAGRRAFGRGDMPAAANLLRRGADVVAADDPARLALLPALGEAMMEIGEFAWAEVYLDEAVERAAELGDIDLHANATLTRLYVLHHTTENLEAWRDEALAEVDRVTDRPSAAFSDLVLAKAWRMLVGIHATVCEWAETEVAAQNAIHHARRAGDTRLEARLSAAYTFALRDGPTPVAEAIERCHEIVSRVVDRQSQAVVLCAIAYLNAMQGEFAAARQDYSRARDLLREVGGGVLSAWLSLVSARIELLAGKPDIAETELRTDYESLAAMGERFYRPLVGALLARAVMAQGRDAEAAELLLAVKEIADDHDVETQALWSSLSAKLAASSGDSRDAEALARNGVQLLRRTDAPVLQAEALVALGEVLALLGREEEAQSALDEALQLYDAKGGEALAQRARALRAHLAAEPAA